MVLWNIPIFIIHAHRLIYTYIHKCMCIVCMDIYMKPSHITYILKTLHCLSSCLKMKSKFLNSEDKFFHDFPFFLYFLVSCHWYLCLTLHLKRIIWSFEFVLFHSFKSISMTFPCLAFPILQGTLGIYIYAFLVFETWFEFFSSVKPTQTTLMISPFSLSTSSVKLFFNLLLTYIHI